MNIRLVVLAAALSSVIFGAACSDKDGDGGDDRDRGTATETRTRETSTATTDPSNGASPTPTESPTPGTAEGPPEHQGDRALEHIRQLSEVIGTREAGGPGDREAVNYIADQFKSYGYDVEVMEFAYEGDRFNTGSVSLRDDSFEGFRMTGSPGGTVTAEAVYVGLANAAEFDGVDAEGKIVIADRGEIPFAEKIQNAQAAGAVGIIVVNDGPDDFIGNAGMGVTIPAVGVAQEHGDDLLDAAESGDEVTIESPGDESTSWNVIARPSADAACKLLAGGHHDTVASAPGALDNASGTATTLEIARAFAADGLDDGLCFATFGAEESGLFGSAALAERMAAEGTLPAVFLNLDMTGLGDTIEIIGSPDLVQRADSIAESLGIAADPSELEQFLGSDHLSFQEEGVPVLFLTTDEFGEFHTPGDVIATIDPTDLENSGDLAYEVVKQVLPTVA